MENPIEMQDLGVPPFKETPIYHSQICNKRAIPTLQSEADFSGETATAWHGADSQLYYAGGVGDFFVCFCVAGLSRKKDLIAQINAGNHSI